MLYDGRQWFEAWRIRRYLSWGSLARSAHEDEYLELRRRLARGVAEQRTLKNLTQAKLAMRLQTSQSRIAKMERADATVSLDLLIRTLLSLGASRAYIAWIIRR